MNIWMTCYFCILFIFKKIAKCGKIAKLNLMKNKNKHDYTKWLLLKSRVLDPQRTKQTCHTCTWGSVAARKALTTMLMRLKANLSSSRLAWKAAFWEGLLVTSSSLGARYHGYILTSLHLYIFTLHLYIFTSLHL